MIKLIQLIGRIFFNQFTYKMKNITVEELKERIDNKKEFHLIDVREPQEFQEYNINGKLIPLGNVRTSIENGDFDEMKNKEIIIHCRSGKRSMMAQMMLAEVGIESINLTGGVLAWADKFDS